MEARKVGDVVGLSGRERARLVVMSEVAGRRRTLVEAADELGLSYRQVKRVWRRYREGGARGLVHGNRGRPSNRQRSEGERAEIVGVYRERLKGFGPTLASEKLAAWGYQVDPETLRRWLIGAELWQRRRRRGPHRRWREPRRRFGELVQMDGSHHDWFGRGELSCLMHMVDDATGRSLAWMEEQETTAAAMGLLWRWIEAYGVPEALYVDGKTVYVSDREATAEEQLAGQEPLTAFGVACRKLGIRIIRAHSAPAKGRVERKHGVYQDRFVKELRLRGVGTIAGANEVLAGGFVDELNERFCREPVEPEDAHRRVPIGVDLASVLVFEQTRKVANDWTIRYENRWYQITGPKGQLPRPRTTVTVQRRLDGRLCILRGGEALEYREIPLAARVRSPAVRRSAADLERVKEARRPAVDHPWRRPFSSRVLRQHREEHTTGTALP